MWREACYMEHTLKALQKLHAMQLNLTVSELCQHIFWYSRGQMAAASNKATDSKNLAPSHSSHHGDLPEHEEAYKVQLYLLMQAIKSFQRIKVLLTPV